MKRVSLVCVGGNLRAAGGPDWAAAASNMLKQSHAAKTWDSEKLSITFIHGWLEEGILEYVTMPWNFFPMGSWQQAHYECPLTSCTYSEFLEHFFELLITLEVHRYILQSCCFFYIFLNHASISVVSFHQAVAKKLTWILHNNDA